MATRECTPGRNRRKVEIDVQAGEYIRYEITHLGPRAMFFLTSTDEDDPLLTSAPGPGPFVREWPDDGQSVADQVHALGVVFASATEYRFKATHFSADGAVLEFLKECTYRRENEQDRLFVSLVVDII